MYYFPGWDKYNPYWRDLQGLPASRSPGKAWPDREPWLGFGYNGDAVPVARKHAQWAQAYGVDFFIYDWYWTKEGKAKLEGALRAYLKVPQDKLKFCLLWANHDEPPRQEIFRQAVNYWLEHFFSDPRYLSIDGKPVVFIFSPENLAKGANLSRSTARNYLSEAQALAREQGLPGIYFVACIQAIGSHIQAAQGAGYDALSAYNYHRGYSGKYQPGGLAESYDELMKGYLESWEWIIFNSHLPYFLPLSAGWDKRPWGSNTPHDRCASTPESFAAMLRQGKEIADHHPQKTKKILVIFAWNEFGEGGYIEPTKKWGFQYLEKIKQVFGR